MVSPMVSVNVLLNPNKDIVRNAKKIFEKVAKDSLTDKIEGYDVSTFLNDIEDLGLGIRALIKAIVGLILYKTNSNIEMYFNVRYAVKKEREKKIEFTFAKLFDTISFSYQDLIKESSTELVEKTYVEVLNKVMEEQVPYNELKEIVTSSEEIIPSSKVEFKGKEIAGWRKSIKRLFKSEITDQRLIDQEMLLKIQDALFAKYGGYISEQFISHTAKIAIALSSKYPFTSILRDTISTGTLSIDQLLELKDTELFEEIYLYDTTESDILKNNIKNIYDEYVSRIITEGVIPETVNVSGNIPELNTKNICTVGKDISKSNIVIFKLFNHFMCYDRSVIFKNIANGLHVTPGGLKIPDTYIRRVQTLYNDELLKYKDHINVEYINLDVIDLLHMDNQLEFVTFVTGEGEEDIYASELLSQRCGLGIKRTLKQPITQSSILIRLRNISEIKNKIKKIKENELTREEKKKLDMLIREDEKLILKEDKIINVKGKEFVTKRLKEIDDEINTLYNTAESRLPLSLKDKITELEVDIRNIKSKLDKDIDESAKYIKSMVGEGEYRKRLYLDEIEEIIDIKNQIFVLINDKLYPKEKNEISELLAKYKDNEEIKYLKDITKIENKIIPRLDSSVVTKIDEANTRINKLLGNIQKKRAQSRREFIPALELFLDRDTALKNKKLLRTVGYTEEQINMWGK